MTKELANAARRELRLEWPAMQHGCDRIIALCGPVLPSTLAMRRDALRIVGRCRLSVRRAMLIAAALDAGCDIFLSEDLHAGVAIDGSLTAVNRFA